MSSFPPRRHRKIAILGFASTVKDCPWNDPTWELWGMNGFWRAAKPDFGLDLPEERYSLWLDTHTLDFTRDYGIRSNIPGEQEAWLQKPHAFPILGIETRPEWPSVVLYPIEEILARFGRDYFTSSVAYAIALALSMDDVAEIGLWGIDLMHNTEYADQRPCAEYWLGRADERGIKITTHERSALLRQRARYGSEDASNALLREQRIALKRQIEGLQEAIAKNQDQVERLRLQVATDSGALQHATEILNRLEVWERGGRIG